jgi:hypothetical protein
LTNFLSWRINEFIEVAYMERELRKSLNHVSLSNLYNSMYGRSTSIALHTQDATAPVLLKRIERAASESNIISLDLRGEISQYATSAQALDLLLTEHVVNNHINPARLSRNLEPIELRFLLPDELTPKKTHGIVDLARLGLHKYLRGLTSKQRILLVNLASYPTANHSENSYEEDSAEVGEVTLLPIIPIEGTPGTVEPLVSQARQKLEELLKQGLPGIDKSYAQQIITFVEESAANVRDHSRGIQQTSKGFIAANRTWRRYQDRIRKQWVEIYTTYVSCYDFGCGVFTALSSVPSYAAEFASYPESEHGVIALRLATMPAVTSIPNGVGRGAGLPRMADIIRNLPNASADSDLTYRGSLKLASHGAILNFLTTTDRASHDRILPGTQLQLRFEAVRRADNPGDS